MKYAEGRHMKHREGRHLRVLLLVRVECVQELVVIPMQPMLVLYVQDLAPPDPVSYYTSH